VTGQRPTRDDPAGRAYLDLRRVAHADGRLTDEYLRLYVLEGFLARLATSQYTEKLTIKGGILLAAYAIRRPTADIDVAAHGVPGQIDQIRDLVASIAAQPSDDGIVFDPSTVHGEQIRDEGDYSGVRVSLTAGLAAAVIRFHVDVNIGDPIWPGPDQVHLPRLLGGEITLRGYPLPMVLAEKTVTAVERGTANTRWRDFADIYLLTGKWAAWRRRLRLDAALPEQFGEVLVAVWAFTDDLLESDTGDGTWHSGTRQWRQLVPQGT
jgi:hypothetical protein